METKKVKTKKAIKQSRTVSARQVAARRRIGCPGLGMFKMKDLEPAGYNPREIDAEALEGLSNSISRFGCVEPIVVNTRGRHNVIVGGNQRFKALQGLGITECLCVTISCSRADEKLLNLTLNNPMIQGDFIKKIEDYIEQLRRELPDDNDFLNLRIAELQSELGRFPGKAGRIPDDDIPKPPKKAVTKTGDLWILGKHRLLCGDSTKEANVKRLMISKKADMVFTDPPYGIDLDTDYSGMKNKLKFAQKKGVRAGRKYRPVIGDKSLFDYSQFNWIDCKEQFWCGGDYYIKTLPDGGNWYVWDKRITENMDKMFGSPFELIWSKNKHRREILRIRWAGIFGTEQEKISCRVHPTQKPIELCRWFIEKYSKNENIILDLFLGSGTTLIACEKLDRFCYAMEIDPIYCDVIVKRWELWTGTKAKRERK